MAGKLVFWFFLLISFAASAFANPDGEAHVVGVYQGADTGLADGFGTAFVKVEREARNVELFLGSFKPVNWNIETKGNTNIEAIYAFGNSGHLASATLNGRPVDLTVIYDLRAAYEPNGKAFRSLVDRITVGWQHERLSSFHGAYTAPDAPFEISDNKPKKSYFPDYLNFYVRSDLLTGYLSRIISGEETRLTSFNSSGVSVSIDGRSLLFPFDMEKIGEGSPVDAVLDHTNERVFLAVDDSHTKVLELDLKTGNWSSFATLRRQAVSGIAYEPNSDLVILGFGFRSSGISVLDASGSINNLSFDELPGLSDITEQGSGVAPNLVPMAIENGQVLAAAKARPYDWTDAKEYKRWYLLDLIRGTGELVHYID